MTEWFLSCEEGPQPGERTPRGTEFPATEAEEELRLGAVRVIIGQKKATEKKEVVATTRKETPMK